MGWAERHGPSAELVRRNDERRKADLLASTVAAYLDARTTANEDRMSGALAAYQEVRRAA